VSVKLKMILPIWRLKKKSSIQSQFGKLKKRLYKTGD